MNALISLSPFRFSLFPSVSFCGCVLAFCLLSPLAVVPTQGPCRLGMLGVLSCCNLRCFALFPSMAALFLPLFFFFSPVAADLSLCLLGLVSSPFVEGVRHIGGRLMDAASAAPANVPIIASLARRDVCGTSGGCTSDPCGTRREPDAPPAFSPRWPPLVHGSFVHIRSGAALTTHSESCAPFVPYFLVH